MVTPNKRLTNLPYCSKILRLFVNSQLGYELRHLKKPIYDRIVQAAVFGGNIVRSDGKAQQSPQPQYNISSVNKGSSSVNFLPGNIDVLDRAKIVAVGIETFVKLASRGVYPGHGGYELRNSERVPMASKSTRSDISDPTLSILQQQQRKSKLSNGELSREEEAYLRRAAMEVGVMYPDTEEFIGPIKTNSTTKIDIPQFPTKEEANVYEPAIPKDYHPSLSRHSNPMESSRERSVPSSRVARLFSFGRLAVGLGTGAVAEIARRTFTRAYPNQNQSPTSFPDLSHVPQSPLKRSPSPSPNQRPSNPFLTPSNAERIVETLCRVRGAALKLGQMLSIQDEHTVPAYLSQIFERVRQSADFMPAHQVDQQMSRELGPNWRTLFNEFDEVPFAAASIGQVHRALTLDGRKVAVKVQYPGVADGIDSDIDNLLSVLNIGGFFPRGMFLDNFATVARRELKDECDYEREARAMRNFKRLLADDQNFYVPGVFPQLSTKRVLTAEFVDGTPIDLCGNEPQEVRDWIATRYIELSLKELFVWRFMQTDPNWSNFLFGLNPATGHYQLVLLDFGSSRSYSKSFIDKYMHIIRAAYENDKKEMLEWSREIGFLTGYESKMMEKAHCDSISIIGETLTAPGAYDFSEQSVTPRINKLVPTMIEHRLTAPPDEIYSLHRKLAGAFLTAAKLRARVACGALFKQITDNYEYGEVPGRTQEINID